MTCKEIGMDVPFISFLKIFYITQVLFLTIEATETYYGLCANPTCSEPIGFGIAVVKYTPGEYGRVKLFPNQEFYIYVKEYGEKKNLIGIWADGQIGYVPNNVVKETKTINRNLVPATVEFVYFQSSNLNSATSQVHVSVSRQEVVHHTSPDTYTNTYSSEQNYHSGLQDSNYYSDGSRAVENSQMYASPHVHVISSHVEATVTSQASNIAQQASGGWESSYAHHTADNSVPSSYSSNVQKTTSQETTYEQSYSQTAFENTNQSPQLNKVLQTSFSSQIQSNSPYSHNSHSREVYADNLGNGAQSYYAQSQYGAAISSQEVRNQYSQDPYASSQYSQKFNQESGWYPPSSSYDTQYRKPQEDISDTLLALKARGFDESEFKAYLSSETANVNPSHGSYHSEQKMQYNYYGNDGNYYGNDGNYYGNDGNYYGSHSSQSGHSADEKTGSYLTNLDSSMSSDSTTVKKGTDLYSGTSMKEVHSKSQVQELLSSEKVSSYQDGTSVAENAADEKTKVKSGLLSEVIPESKEEKATVTPKSDSNSISTKIESDTSSVLQEQAQNSDAQEPVAKTTTYGSDSGYILSSTSSKETILSAKTVTGTENTVILDSTVDSFSKDSYKESTVLDETEKNLRESPNSDTVGDISMNENSMDIVPNNTIVENMAAEITDRTDVSADTIAFDVTKSDYKTDIFSFNNVENMFDNIETINETDIYDKEQMHDLDKMLNISEMSDTENSGYSNAYQIRNLKGEQNTKNNQNAEASDEIDENATYSEFFLYQSIENSLGAIRSFIEILLPWIPEPLYTIIMDLESKGISPRVPVFTALSAIPCLFLIVAVVYIREKSKEKTLNAQLAFAEKNIYTFTAEKNILEEKLEKAEAEIELSKSTLNSERKFYEDLKLEVVNLNQELDKANLTLESKSDEIEAFKKQEKEFHELITEKEKVHLELTEEKNQLINQLNGQDETLIQLNNQLQQNEKELKELQEEKLQFLKTNEVYEEKLTQLQQNCNQLLKEAEIWNLRLSELNSKLNEESQAKLELEECLKTKDDEIKALTFLVESFKSYEELENTDEDEEKSKKEKLQSFLNSASISISLQNQEEENEMLMQKLAEEKNKVLDMEVELLEAKSEIDKLKLSYNHALQDKTEAQTKLDVLTNYFKDKEIQLQKQLGAQEVFREKREKDADSAERRICLIEQENASYKSQVASMKQEMEETERNLKSQIAVQEKKAHENWIAARAAERKLEDMKQEVTQLRQKLTLIEREQGNFMNSTRDDIIRPIPQRITGINDETINSQDINNSIDEPHMYRMPPIPPPMLLPDMPRDRPLPPLPPIPPPFEPPMFAPPPFGHFPPRDPMFSSEFRVTPPEFVRGRASTPPRGRQSAITDGDVGPRQSSPIGSEMRESRNSTPPHSLPDFHDIPPPPRPFFPHHRFPFRPPFRREFAQGPRPDYQMENSSARGTQPSSVPQENWPSTNSRV
ncbi:transport and Golgi organization protein 1 homolog [Trichonephila clavata]|uniref:Transport and Golgi organization protein 1 homolog n=1 Tax=Trichonephila clavata TaxID=2740835 RepID=A0A8X6IGA8_TRICU|nr:transport and Golgi organization protein 1 homolog [Trichonephila clavata]